MSDESKQRPAYNYRVFLKTAAPAEGEPAPGNAWYYERGKGGPTVSCGYCGAAHVQALEGVTAFGEIDQKPCGEGAIPVRLQDWDAGRGVVMVIDVPAAEAAPQ